MTEARTTPHSGSDALPLVNRDNPWPGLIPFDEATSGFFFGRENETAELERLIRRDTLSVVYGQSGLGKTSLLRAGLMPRLRQAGYLPVYLRLAHDETAPALAEQVKAALADALAAAHVEAPTPRATETLWEYFHRTDLDFWSPRNRRLVPVLMIDQFEELFTVGRQTAAHKVRAKVFLDELACLVTGRAPAAVQARLDATPEEAVAFDYEKQAVNVLLSLREDFLPDFESLREPCRWNAQNRFRLRRMTGDQAWDVVAKPGAGLVDDAVTARIVDFVSSSRRQRADIVHTRGELSQREVEPALLSVVCRELNNRRLTLRQSAITADLLTGSKEEITRGFYESALADQPSGVRAFVEDELLTGSGFRKKAASEDALKAPGVTPEAVQTLVNRRLLRQEESGGVVWVELTHDLLTDVAQASRSERQHREALAAAADRERELKETLTKTRRGSRRLIALVSAGLVCALLWFYTVAKPAIGFAKAIRRATPICQEDHALIARLLDHLQFCFRSVGRLDMMNSVNRMVGDYYANVIGLERYFSGWNNYPSKIKPLFEPVLWTTLYACKFYQKEGDVLQEQGMSEAARECYQRSLMEAEKLYGRIKDDPVPSSIFGVLGDDWNSWISFRASLYLLIGELRQTLGDSAGALSLYRDALSMSEQWSAVAHKDSPLWILEFTRDMIIKVKSLAISESNQEGALQADEASKRVIERMAASTKEAPYLHNWNTFGWSCLQFGEYKQAKSALLEGLKSIPGNLVLQGNLAHAHMFLGEKADAEALYLRYKGQRLSDNRVWEHIIAEDFATFRKLGMEHPQMMEIEALLAIEPTGGEGNATPTNRVEEVKGMRP